MFVLDSWFMSSGFILATSLRLSPVSASKVTNILSNGVAYPLSRVGMASMGAVALTGFGTFGVTIFVVGALALPSNHL